MNHLNEDSIYKFALELLNPSETEDAEKHFEHCKKCSEKLHEINDQISLLGDFDPEIPAIDNPLLKQKSNSTIWLKRAAAFLIFMLLGYYASISLNIQKINVGGQSLTPGNFGLDTLKYIYCPSIDIYYQSKP